MVGRDNRAQQSLTLIDYLFTINKTNMCSHIVTLRNIAIQPSTAVDSCLYTAKYGLSPYALLVSKVSISPYMVRYREPYNDGYTAVLYGDGAQP